MLKWSPCDLEPFLRGRTLWLIGDSLTQQMGFALSCLMMDFADDQKTCATGSRRVNKSAVERFQPIDPENHASPCLHLRGPQGGRICLVAAFVAQQLTNSTRADWGFYVRYGNKTMPGGLLPSLRARHAQPHDIFVINVGRHHRHYDRPDEYPGRFRAGLRALGRYVQATRKEWPHVLWREVPAQHPASEESGNSACGPLAGFEFNKRTGKVERVPGQAIAFSTRGPSLLRNRTWDIRQPWPNHDVVAREVLPSYDIPIVPGYDVSVGMGFAHRGDDCSHSCIPGVPEVQAYELFKALKSGVTGIKPLPPSVKLAPPCIL